MYPALQQTTGEKCGLTVHSHKTAAFKKLKVRANERFGVRAVGMAAAAASVLGPALRLVWGPTGAATMTTGDKEVAGSRR